MHCGYRQMWVFLHIQSRRSSLDAAEQKMLHRVEDGADGAQQQGVSMAQGHVL